MLLSIEELSFLLVLVPAKYATNEDSIVLEGETSEICRYRGGINSSRHFMGMPILKNSPLLIKRILG
jgi:hypothetical protein